MFPLFFVISGLPSLILHPFIPNTDLYFYIFYFAHSLYCSPLAVLLSTRYIVLAPLSSSLGWHSQGERMFPLGLPGLSSPFPGPYLFFLLF